MELTTVWFALIAVLWIGYFCLEGFDFGVGMLLPVLARNDTERRVMINTIGPLWDGNGVGSSLPATTSPHSQSGTPRCSAASTCRCC